LEIVASLAMILAAVLLGAMSPGASFLTVARISMAGKRIDGIAASAGMGIGGTVLALLAILGMKAVLIGIPQVYAGLRALGGLYLIYIGVQTYRRPRIQEGQGVVTVKQDEPWRICLFALAVQLSNPKTILFYASIFAALLPNEMPPLVMIVLPIMVFIVETAWYTVVALVLSSPVPRSGYLRQQVAIDRIAGALMAFIGGRLIASIWIG
jgi:threonine/homoserine/homoserine lactone efflux protein